MLTIELYQEGDQAVWIPVAKGKGGGTARAFLPFNGLNGSYTYGFKAAPNKAGYFEALREIQRSFIADDSQIFVVNGGSRKERQRKARWRHGNKEGSPLLGPTLGWILVLIDDLNVVSHEELGLVLDGAAQDIAVLPPRVIPPVLCNGSEDLEREAARLLKKLPPGKPAGQIAPKRIASTTEQFVRDAAVVAYVLHDADGTCECCGEPAPFTKRSGLPYLEVHHIRRLADEGPDSVCNAVAICPNCHRELHHGVKAVELAESLFLSVKRLVRL